MPFTVDRKQALVVAGSAVAILLIGLAAVRSGGDDPVGSRGERVMDGSATDAGLVAGRRSRRVTVDVSGAVSRPGVYRMPDGARVIDAISRAGGPIRSAIPSAINRAALLVDGQQVVVPARGRVAGVAGGTSSPGPVSLGTATQAELEQIDGIGPVTAGKIIEFRDQRGGIGSIDELDQISGIGPATLESLRSGLQP